MRALRGANAAADLARSTRSCGVGRPTTGAAVSSEVFSPWTTTCGSSTYKWAAPPPPEQVEALGRRPLLRPVPSAPGATGGCSATATAALYLAQVRLDKIVRHQLVKGAASPDDPDLTDYWARRRRKTRSPRSASTPSGCSSGSTADARSAGPICCTPTTHPRSPQEWEQWFGRHPQSDHGNKHYRIAVTSGSSTPARTNNALSTPTAPPAPPAAAAGTSTSARLTALGLLEPGAGKACTPGS